MCVNDDCLTIYTNGGSQLFKKTGTLKLFPMSVHYNGESMENILSMKDIVSLQGVQVNFDSLKEYAMLVNYKDEVYRFKEYT